jgi:hypothetical protein
MNLSRAESRIRYPAGTRRAGTGPRERGRAGRGWQAFLTALRQALSAWAA